MILPSAQCGGGGGASGDGCARGGGCGCSSDQGEGGKPRAGSIIFLGESNGNQAKEENASGNGTHLDDSESCWGYVNKGRIGDGMINSVLGTGYLLEEATATRMLRLLCEVMVSKDFFVRPLLIGFLAYVSKINVLSDPDDGKSPRFFL